ncbi:Hypothetical protein R9X50_00793300 [Acrodontium crateriforme]|uniref:Inositol polyphosphate-related phosphatase domain-containing protein n=1 Tax=Acrodontium crateriforme TaxID=150365 RepID=A0AAQ3MC16_9PEZI|nr:Hypothetical protein R9X50_00793300 [Acrodontium crateriforme]
MADNLRIYLATFNCGRELLDVNYFAANLFNGYEGELPPDLIVLSLQEIAPLGYSFLGGSFLNSYFMRFNQAIIDGTGLKFGKNAGYSQVIARNAGMTGIVIFAKHGVEERVRSMQTGAVGVGFWSMGNKGAVGVRLRMDLAGYGSEESVLSFVAAHLAPAEDQCERRNQDWKSICEGLVFEGTSSAKRVTGESEAEPLLSEESDGKEDGSLFRPASYLFFAGDLNYRTSDTAPEPGSQKDWPQPVESRSDPHHWSQHLPKDQLIREMKRNNTLHLLDEAPINFGPTYKFSSAASKQALHAVESQTRELADGRQVAVTSYKAGANEDVWLWAQHRTPSWCDRILFLAASKPTVHSYAALPVQPTSDHRPVALSLSIPAKPFKVDGVEPPFDVKPGWKERRATARRYELMVGLVAFLGYTWEGEALLAGTLIGLIGGYFALSALIVSSS